MSMDTFGRITSQGGRPYYEQGSTTPGIEFSESERPAVGLIPAPYLPAGRFDAHKRANVMLSAGTPVSLDGAGNLIPAGIPGDHAFVYTALDFTTNLAPTLLAATGAAVTTAGNSIMQSGLLAHGEFARPIGVVSYNAFQFEGKTTVGAWGNTYTIDHSNPTGFGVHNTMAQDLVAVTCDYVLQIPYIFGKNLLAGTTKILDNDANEVAALTGLAKSFPFAHDELIAVATVAPGTGTPTLNSGTFQTADIVSTGISGSLTNLEIIYVSPACGQGDNGAAGPWAGDGSLVFVSGASGVTLAVATVAGDAATAGAGVTFATLSAKGNFVLHTSETEKYVVLRNSTGGAALTTGATFRLTLGDQITPGCSVVCREGKFVAFNKNRHEANEIIGQALRVDKSPAKKDYLDRVKTAYDRSATVAHRMAGSATRGVPYLLHLVTDGAQVLFDTNKTLAGSALNSSGMTTPPLALVVINMTR